MTTPHDLPKLKAAMADVKMVCHLAADAEVWRGPERTRKDLDQKTNRHLEFVYSAGGRGRQGVVRTIEYLASSCHHLEERD